MNWFPLWWALAAATGQSAAAARPSAVLVLPSGETSERLNEVVTELTLGFQAALRERLQQQRAVRFRAMLTPGKLTGDVALIKTLTGFASFYGMAEEERRALVDKIQRLEVEMQDVKAVLRVAISTLADRLEVTLELGELAEGSFQLMLSKTIGAADLPSIRTRLRKVGALLLSQTDQGRRPSPWLVAPAEPRAGREVTVDIRDLEDPEYDTLDWAWCLADGPVSGGSALAIGSWRRGERQIRFSPAEAGEYLLLVWSAESLRGEVEPDCAAGSGPVTRLKVDVQPSDRWTLFGGISYDVTRAGSQRLGILAGRLGGEFRFYRRAGVRAAFDVFQRMGASRMGPAETPVEARAAWLGATTIGLSMSFPVWHGAVLTPHLSSYWHDPDSMKAAHLGLGGGADLRMQLRGQWSCWLGFDGFRVKNGQLQADPWMSRFRSAIGAAMIF